MKLLFFGELAEIVGGNEMQMDGIESVQALKERLEYLHPNLEGKVYAIAVNKAIVSENVSLQMADEIAFMPAFSGG